MICQQLRITDGTSIVDLLNPSPGIHLNSWNPQIQQPKNGAVFQDSPLAPGRRRVYSQFANADESFNFKINDLTRNKVLQHISDMIALLEKAIDYWETDYQNTPVYLIVQTNEGGIQYAVIKSYSFLELDNPFAQPFFTSVTPVMDELNLSIERGEWLDNIPGTSEATSILVQGSEYSTQGITYLAGHYSPTEITHIYIDDGGVFGANQVASTSFNLLPAAPAINDAVYFGNDDEQPLLFLIFDLATIFAGTSVTGVWEYWTGATWSNTASFDEDRTLGFTELGVNSIYFNYPAATATTTVNGVLGFWYRFRVTAATGVTSVPSQQNRIVYEANRSYIQIASGTVLGTLPALAKFTLDNVGNVATAYRRYILALRSLSRGTNFYPFINLTDTSQISGITVSVAAGTGNAFDDDFDNPTGRNILYDASTDGIAAGTTSRRFSIALANTIAPDYTPGRYKVYLYLREGPATAGNTFNAFFRLENSARTVRYWQSDTVELTYTSSIVPNYFGVVNIPNIGTTDFTLDFYFNIDSKNTDLQFDVVLLIPTDEWAILTDFGLAGTSGNGENDGDNYLIIDSTNPKIPISAIVYNDSDDTTYSTFSFSANGEAIVKDDCKIWMFIVDSTINQPTMPHNISLYRNDRYLSLRGSR